jgi:hypothetical protein
VSDFYAVIRRERELQLGEVDRRRALGLMNPGRSRWFRGDLQVRIGNPIAAMTHGRRRGTGPRTVSPR